MDNDTSENNKLALNRSYSFSGSPIAHKVCVEQAFQNKSGETLVRQYSCQQIYDSSNKKPKLQFKESVFLHSPKKVRKSSIPSLGDNPSSSLFNQFESSDQLVSNFQSELERFPFTSTVGNLFNFHKNCPEQEGFEQSLMDNKYREDKIQECTPMDVDTSMEDHSMSDVHFPHKMGDGNEGHKSKISKMIISPNTTGETFEKTRNPPRKLFLKYLKMFAMFFIPIACAFVLMNSDIFFNEDTHKYNTDNFKSENITNALHDLVYGQQEALAKIKESFKYVGDNHLLIFTGGIGVGKTYSANIISNNFQWKNNVIKIISPQYKNSYHENELIRGLSEDGYNLVIVDNLELDDVQTVIPFVKKLFGTDKKVIIILIYTTPELSFDMATKFDLISSSNHISDSLSEAKLKHSLIIFNKLNIDVVKKCIHFAMAKKGLIINQHNIENILQNVNYEYSGCKGVYTKVALLR